MYFARNDKRAFKRLTLNMPIEITKEALVIQGICKDLSSTGMLITFADERLQADDRVQIQLDSPDTRFPPLDALATLLRIDNAEEGFRAAVEFISVK